MRAEIHGPDGRHVVLDAKGCDLDALVVHAERLYHLTEGPSSPVRTAGFGIPCEAPRVDGMDGLTQPDIQLRRSR